MATLVPATYSLSQMYLTVLLCSAVTIGYVGPSWWLDRAKKATASEVAREEFAEHIGIDPALIDQKLRDDSRKLLSAFLGSIDCE